jgi:hypothetical protein
MFMLLTPLAVPDFVLTFGIKYRNFDKCQYEIGDYSMPRLRLIESGNVPPGIEFSGREIHAMQRAVIKLFGRWGISDDQAAVLLGGIAPRTFQRWKAGEYGRVGPDLSARLSNLMGIHKALRLLFKDENRGYGWVKRANETYGGRTALDMMLGGRLTDLMRVRHYLDSMRSPW